MASTGRFGLRSCDRCGVEDESVEIRWLVFGDPRMRQADLCAIHWKELRDVVAPYLVNARIANREVANAINRLRALHPDHGSDDSS